MVLKYNDRGHPYEDVALENKKLQTRLAQLDKSLSIALENVDKYQRHIEQVKKEADQLMMNKIIKYEKEINQLKADLARAKEDHQYDNLVHANELKRMNQK